MSYINKLGIKTWNYAQDILIGGTGLLSKRPTRYSGAKWPCYYEKATGIKIKSIDGYWFNDFSEFSIGCNILGYGPKSHKGVTSNYKNSSPLSTLCSKYEPELALKLNNFLEKNLSWKFCRGGGEALAVSVRLARTFTKNKKILVCGYHGFHDWYLSSNLSSINSLNGIFLKGLNVDGIPNEYQGTTSAIKTTSPKELSKSIKSFNPGIIVFESARYELLSQSFCQILKDFQKSGGILISDEVTSGFRFERKIACYQIGLDPDIIVLGKSLGGGYAISAIGIQKKYHDTAQQCFLSSTHWTEEIGLKAGICTLNYLRDWEKSYQKLLENSILIKDSIESGFLNADIRYKINSIPTMINFSANLEGINEKEFFGLLNYRMLKRGYIISSTIYPTLKHTKRDIKLFKKSLEVILENIKYDYEKNFDFIKKEIKELGKLETGFSRTQQL